MTFPVFDSVNAAINTLAEAPKDWVIRQSAAKLSVKDHIFDRPADAHAFVEQLHSLPVGAIAIDTEYQYRAPGVPLKGGRHTWHDPSTLDPLILTGAAWVPEEGHMVRFLLDLRPPGMATVVEYLLSMRTTFVALSFGAEFHSFWALGLSPVLHQVYDTYVAARALLLGRGHRTIELRHAAQRSEDWKSLESADAELASLLSLTGQCEAYGISHPFAGSKSNLQASFLDHPDKAQFSKTQLEYALADAECTLRLYLTQQADVTAAGLNSHLHQVEFPFAEANARMEFDGVPVDHAKLSLLAQALDEAVSKEVEILNSFGLDNPASAPQVIAFLKARGWGDKITSNGTMSSADKVLEGLVALDPAIPHIRAFRRYKSLSGGQFISGELLGADGRFHPRHRHLGAETGRNTISAPNLVGLSRNFRPIITAPPGRAIIEADYAQIEVGIAAAEARDVELIAAFNSGDVYAAVARAFYWNRLTKDEQSMTLDAFKKERGDLRNKIKVFVLATLYNMQDQAIADRFAVPLDTAKEQRAAFLSQYPGISKMMADAEHAGRIRGFAPVIGGMKRHITSGYSAANKHMNTPVQAGAGVVFRKAVADLYQCFRGTTTQLILPVHDAVVVECDAANVEAVRTMLPQVMSQAVRSFYPDLDPRIDINASATECWNKDGDAKALDRFLQETGALPSATNARNN